MSDKKCSQKSETPSSGWLDQPTEPGYWWYLGDPSNEGNLENFCSRGVLRVIDEDGVLTVEDADGSAKYECSIYRGIWKLAVGPLICPIPNCGKPMRHSKSGGEHCFSCLVNDSRKHRHSVYFYGNTLQAVAEEVLSATKALRASRSE